MITPGTKLRVVVFVSSLGAGGAERVAVRVCGWLREAGKQVCLLTLSGIESDFYPCPEGVERVGLNLQSPSRTVYASLWNNIRRLFAVRSAVNAFEADVVVALGASSNVLMLLALIGKRCRKIISERADPVRQPLSLGWDLLRRHTYTMANIHVSQSTFVSSWLKRRCPGLRCVIIGNTSGAPPGNPGTYNSFLRDHHRPLRLVTLGRLSREKGTHILLDAFAEARLRCPVPIELTVVGDGEERETLETQVGRLGLDRWVSFTGKVSNVWQELSRSSIYVLPSLTEGFPNAMIEAMAAGVPVIAARCQGGVDDLLGDAPGRYALEFAPGDSEALASAIITLASSPELRHRLALAAKIRSSDYNSDRISEKWLRVVEG